MGRLKGGKNAKSKMIKVVCLGCGKEKLIYPYRKDSFKFCSHSCRAKNRIVMEITRKKMSDNMKNKWKKGILKSKVAWNKGTKGVMNAWNKGLKDYHSGKNHYNWQGGISFEPYGLAFNNKLKEQIRKRDNYRCQQCFRYKDELYSKTGKKYKLHIHHIDYDKKNNKENNLISLCRCCHMQTNFKRKNWANYFNKKIYELHQQN